jgi:predicted nucleic acid-binding protein
MTFVDTNVLLRWLLGDHEQLSSRAQELVETAAQGSLVLRSTGRDRIQTTEALLLIARTPAFKYEHEELMMDIISLVADTNLDFADCYLLARAKREQTGLVTFDRPREKRYRA